MEALLVEALRTPRAKARASSKGKPGGGLHAFRPVELVAALVEALRERKGALGPIDDLLLGCVTQVGDQGTNVARLAALWAGLGDPRSAVPRDAVLENAVLENAVSGNAASGNAASGNSVPGVTINRFCTSSLDAIGMAAGKLAMGDSVVLAGGVEMPSRAPMFADEGAWSKDALVAERTRFVHMGVAADLLATEHGFLRDDLDAYALRSQERAARAEHEGHFVGRVSVGSCTLDETIRPETSAESLAAMSPAYAELAGPARDARHTIGSSPALADGASLCLLATQRACDERGWTPRARLLGYASVAVDPLRMLHGNPLAAREALRRASLRIDDVDLWEVNESFAVVPLLFQREMGVADDALNVDGGAIALGHPLGATGGVLTSMLLDALERRSARIGVTSICGGAGVATALVWERLA